MSKATQSRWYAAAAEHVSAIIADGALQTDADLRRRLREEGQMFAAGASWPLRAWRRAVRDLLPRRAELAVAAAVGIDFAPRHGVPADYLPFLVAMAADPRDQSPRLIFADYLDERGDGNAEGVRWPEVDTDAVVRWVYGPGSGIVYIGYGGGDSRRRIHGRHGADLGPASLVEDHIAGKTLLIFPEVRDAVHVEETAAALRLFGDVADSAAPRARRRAEA